jgi:hypothetical protein
MSDLSDLASQHPHWSLGRSDRGRWWATRTRPFSREVEERTKAFRTVDGDDMLMLARLMAEQEAMAASVDHTQD